MEPSRTTLLDTNLLYLFSYDVNLEMRRDELGFVPGGARINIFARPRETRVYHKAEESTAGGERAIEGTVTWGADWAFIREDDICVVDARLMIETDDHACIYSTYSGVFPIGPRGFRRLLSKHPPVGTDKKPELAPVYVTPRYETASPKYRWLVQHQCVGFGEAVVVESKIRGVSFDIYAMDA